MNKTGRRSFIRTTLRTTATGTAIVAGAAIGLGVDDLLEPHAAWAARLRDQGRGRIVGVQHSGALTSMTHEVSATVEKMTHEAILHFTGKKSLAKAWREFVSASDTVGIKLNCLAAPGVATSPAMVAAIVRGLRAVGIPNQRIILYEQYEKRLVARGSGYQLNEDPSKGPLVRHMAGKKLLIQSGFQGYEPKPTRHASGASHYSNALKRCTAIINAPVIKDHNLAGVTVGMKNMTHGNINNPQEFHAADCHPAIADIYDHPKIRDKVRLVVCDALKVLYDGGPSDNPRARARHNRIYVATDPVAMDAWGLKVVTALRKQKGLQSLASRNPNAHWLQRAEELGLGLANPKRLHMELTKLG